MNSLHSQNSEKQKNFQKLMEVHESQRLLEFQNLTMQIRLVRLSQKSVHSLLQRVTQRRLSLLPVSLWLEGITMGSFLFEENARMCVMPLLHS